MFFATKVLSFRVVHDHSLKIKGLLGQEVHVALEFGGRHITVLSHAFPCFQCHIVSLMSHPGHAVQCCPSQFAEFLRKILYVNDVYVNIMLLVTLWCYWLVHHWYIMDRAVALQQKSRTILNCCLKRWMC